MKNYLTFSFIAFSVIFIFSFGTVFSQMRKIEDPDVYTEGTFYELDGDNESTASAHITAENIIDAGNKDGRTCYQYELWHDKERSNG